MPEDGPSQFFNPRGSAQILGGSTSGLTQISPRKPPNHSRPSPCKKNAQTTPCASVTETAMLFVVVEESSLAETAIDLSNFRARHHRLHTPLSGLPSLRKIAGHEKTLFPIDGLRGPVCLLQLQLQRKNTKVSAYRAGEDNHSKNHNQEPQFHYCRDPNITILLICK